MFKLDTLAKKVLAPALLFMTIAMALGGALLVSDQSRLLTTRMDEAAQHQADFVALVSAAYVTNYDLAALGSFIKGVLKDDDVAFAEFVDATGKSLTADVMKAPDKLDNLIVMERDIKDTRGQIVGHFRLGHKRDAITRALGNAAMVITLGIVMALIVLCVVLTITVRRAVRPAQAIARSLERLAEGEGDLSSRIALKSDDELGAIVNHFNRFMDKLQSLV